MSRPPTGFSTPPPSPAVSAPVPVDSTAVPANPAWRRLKSLIASPHFKFQQFTARSATSNAELPPPTWTSPNSGAPAESDRSGTIPAPPVHPESTPASPPAAVGAQLSGLPGKWRLDAAHASVSPPHLPTEAIEQFLGWTETTVDTWDPVPPAGGPSIPNAPAPAAPTPPAPAPTADTRGRERVASHDDQILPATDGASLERRRSESSPWVYQAETFQAVTQFDHALTFASQNYRWDSGTMELPGPEVLTRESPVTAEPSRAIEPASSYAAGQPSLPALSEILRKAFEHRQASAPRANTTWDHDSNGPPAEVSMPMSASHESSQEASGLAGAMSAESWVASGPQATVWDASEAAVPVEVRTGAAEAWRRRNLIRVVDEPQWSPIVEKLLSPGRPVLEKLASAIRRFSSEVSSETLITSKARGDGSTTITLALARYFAEQGEQVLVVDADTQTGGLTRALGFREIRSWVTLVRGGEILDKSFMRTAETMISVAPLMPLRLRTIWPPYVLDHLCNLLTGIRGVFDRILIDAGTTQQLMSELSGNRTLAPHALVVTEAGGLDQDQLTRIKANLVGVGVEQVLVAQNFAPRSIPQSA